MVTSLQRHTAPSVSLPPWLGMIASWDKLRKSKVNSKQTATTSWNCWKPKTWWLWSRRKAMYRNTPEVGPWQAKGCVNSNKVSSQNKKSKQSILGIIDEVAWCWQSASCWILPWEGNLRKDGVLPLRNWSGCGKIQTKRATKCIFFHMPGTLFPT